MALAQLNFGDRYRQVAIGRSDVALNTTSRAVLVDPNPRAALIGYDDVNKIAVHLDQDAMIKYRIPGRTNYLFLIARLSTDMNGRIVDTKFQLEYVRLSDRQYESFCSAVDEIGEFTSITLKKIPQGEYAYIQLNPSKKEPIDSEILEAISGLDVESCWTLVEMDCAKTVEQYEEILAKRANSGGVAISQGNQQRAVSQGNQQRAVSQGNQQRAVSQGNQQRAHTNQVENPQVSSAPKDEFDDVTDF